LHPIPRRQRQTTGKPRYLLGSLPVLIPLAFAAPAIADQPASVHREPWQAESNGPQWEKIHADLVSAARMEDPEIVFLGDSITARWLTGGRRIWDERFRPRHAACLGIGGDTTQNVLWRIDHGALDQISPKVVVLLIGTNDIPHWPTAEVIRGIDAVVDRIGERLPNTEIVLYAVFPRGDLPELPIRKRQEQLETAMAAARWGGHVIFQDIDNKFLDQSGYLDPSIMADGLHPTELGFQIWADSIEPVLDRLLKH
jgi:lysophospholipase L1-like esterase